MIRSNRKSPTIFLVLLALMMTAVGFTHDLRSSDETPSNARADTQP